MEVEGRFVWFSKWGLASVVVAFKMVVHLPMVFAPRVGVVFRELLVGGCVGSQGGSDTRVKSLGERSVEGGC